MLRAVNLWIVRNNTSINLQSKNVYSRYVNLTNGELANFGIV